MIARERWPDTAPNPGLKRALEALPRWSRVELPSGLSIVLVERPRLPIIHLTFTARAGGLYDPPGREGVAALVPSLLREGTRSRSAAQVSAAAEDLGGSLVPFVNWSAGSLSLGLLADDVKPGLDLLLDLIVSPAFPEPAVDMARQRTLRELRGQALKPVVLASRCLDRALYGEGPYARPLEGSRRSLEQVTADDLREFHLRRFGGSGSALLAVGRFRSDELIHLLEGAMPELGRGEPPFVSAFPAVAEAPPRWVLVDVPDARQTELRLGHLTIPQGHPEADRLRLLTTILSGGVSGRLNRRLREDLGYTYQVRTYFRARMGRGLFVVETSLRTDRVAVAVDIISEELRRLQDVPISAAELSAAQARSAGVLLHSLQTSYELAAQLVNAGTSRYSADYFRGYIERIYDVTPQSLQQIAREHLRLQDLTVVAVGPAGELRRQVPAHDEALELNGTQALDGNEDSYERRSARESQNGRR